MLRRSVRARSILVSSTVFLAVLTACGGSVDQSSASHQVQAFQPAASPHVAGETNSTLNPAATVDESQEAAHESSAPAEGSVVYTQPASPRTDFVKYEDEVYPFEVWLPREWYIGQLSEPSYGVTVLSDDDPGAERAIMMFLVEPVGSDAEVQGAATTAEETLSTQPGIENFQRELARPAVVNGARAEERTYSYTLNGTRMRQRSIFLLGDGQLYALNLIAPRHLYAQHDALFNDVIASFKGD
jgi:hypothetical protein